MKTPSYFLSCGMALYMGIFLLACNADEPAPEKTKTGDPITVEELDTLSNRFDFFYSTKLVGNTPAAPDGNLKFSIKDTLYLGQGFYVPVKFLHDKLSDVKGVFIQIVGPSGGALASTYFDVPEIPDVSDSDTVSVIVIQFDPTDFGSTSFDLPLFFNIKITPHDQNGQALDEGIVPVKVEPLNDDITGPPATDLCGLTDGYWQWDLSYNPKQKPGVSQDDPDLFVFWNDPSKVWGKDGQIINGCCCAGISIYNQPCPCSAKPNASLHFATYMQYVMETLTFYENGTYYRQTIQNYAIPLPISSDFCGNAEGEVRRNILSVSYSGNWSVQDHNGQNLLTLTQTSSTPDHAGYGNGGGRIHYLTCEDLTLAEPQEGEGNELYKFYKRRSNYQNNTPEYYWHDISGS